MTIPTPENAARFLSEFGGMAQGEAENCLAQLIQVDLIGEPSSPLSAKQAAIVAIAWLTRVNGTPSDLLSAGDLCINHVESYPEHEGTQLPKPILEALGPVEALPSWRQNQANTFNVFSGDVTKRSELFRHVCPRYGNQRGGHYINHLDAPRYARITAWAHQ